MDLIYLAKALTISTDDNERKQNEKYLAEAKMLPNYLPALLTITCESPEANIALIASIQLKNFVNSNWKYGENQELNSQLKFDKEESIIPISKVDKSYIRSHILQALYNSVAKGNLKVTKQLNQAIKKISKLDFNEIWKEEFMSQIIAYFNSGNEVEIFAGILAFSQVAKVHEFESGKYRENYNKSFEYLNSFFLNIIGSNMISSLLQTENGNLIVYKIYKIFSRSIQLDICPTILNEENFEKWNLSLLSTITSEVPSEYSTKTEKTEICEKNNKSIFWKLRRLCFAITYRLYQKYGNKETVEKDKPQLVKFFHLVSEKCLPHYFNSYIQILQISKTQYVPGGVLCLIYKFLATMLSRFDLINLIETQLTSILSDNIIQNSMLTLKDIELYTNDPKTYIHKQFDITENFYILRYAVCQFIRSLCTFRQRDPTTHKIKTKSPPPYYSIVFNYLITILDQYEGQIKSGNDVDLRIKESVLYIFGSIAGNVIKRNNQQIPEIVRLYVLKEFDSPCGFLRERACTFFETFEDYKWENGDLISEVTRKICNILDSENDLPVKVMAAITAPILIKNKGVQEMLKPHVPKLLEIYLNLVNTIDLEEILSGLETIVMRFNHAVKEHAVSLAFELVKVFKRLSESEEDDEKGDSITVLEGVLRTLLKIIELFVNDESIFSQIEPQIHQIILWGLKPENFEKFDDTLDILNVIVKKQEKISNSTWTYFPDIIYSLIGTKEEQAEFKQSYPDLGEFEGLGFESINDVIPLLCNYIVKDPESFTSLTDKYNISLSALLFELVQRIITISKSKSEYQNVRYALKLINVVIETLKGKIDSIVVSTLIFLLHEIVSNPKPGYKIALIETIADCFYYNPVLAISTVQNANFVEALFKIWIMEIPKLNILGEMKRSLMGLMSVVSVDPKEQNPLIIQNMKTIIDTIMTLAGAIDAKREKSLVKNAKKLDLDDQVAEIEEDDEAREEQLNEFLQKAKESTMGDNTAKNDLNDEELWDDEDEDDEDWEEFEDLTNITLVDSLDEILYIKNTFNLLLLSNSNYYQDLTKLINDEDKMKLESFVKNAEDRLKLNERKI